MCSSFSPSASRRAVSRACGRCPRRPLTKAANSARCRRRALGSEPASSTRGSRGPPPLYTTRAAPRYPAKKTERRRGTLSHRARFSLTRSPPRVCRSEREKKDTLSRRKERGGGKETSGVRSRAGDRKTTLFEKNRSSDRSRAWGLWWVATVGLAAVSGNYAQELVYNARGGRRAAFGAFEAACPTHPATPQRPSSCQSAWKRSARARERERERERAAPSLSLARFPRERERERESRSEAASLLGAALPAVVTAERRGSSLVACALGAALNAATWPAKPASSQLRNSLSLLCALFLKPRAAAQGTGDSRDVCRKGGGERGR